MENAYRIMVVDDERIVREAIASHISWEEYGIVMEKAAPNAIEALEYLKWQDVDLMLLDIKMPVMDGIELLRRVKESKSSMDVIILSGYTDFTYAQEALRYGARDYLLKPLDQEALINVILKCKNERRGQQLMERMHNAIAWKSQGDDCEAGKHYSVTIRKILKIVQEEIANENLCLKWISSEKLFLNENYLGKVFQKEVGKKFTAYVLEQRMLVAMQQLARDEDILVLDVARACGFGENSQYFSSTFKKYTGYTPTEYRKCMKEAMEK